MSTVIWLRWQSVCLQCGKPGFDPWVEKILWRRKWQPTPVLLPRKSHGWRTLVGYSPWGGKQSETTERLHFHAAVYLGAWIIQSIQIGQLLLNIMMCQLLPATLMITDNPLTFLFHNWGNKKLSKAEVLDHSEWGIEIILNFRNITYHSWLCIRALPF